MDYCFDHPEPDLEFVGKDPVDLPLGLCQGDCDSDDECKGHLTCFFNGEGDANIPEGCGGTAGYGIDYCYDTAPTMKPTADPTTDPTAEPTTEPTAEPTTEPTSPTRRPSWVPTAAPTTSSPTSGAPT